MKILDVQVNNRKKAFELETKRGNFLFPFAELEVKPSSKDPVLSVDVDAEIGAEGFSYSLKSGQGDTVLLDQVLSYNADPNYLSEQHLYQLTIKARELADTSDLSVREICRLLKTSASQYYRLLDPTNYKKSIGQMIALIHVLGSEVELTVR